MVRRRLVRSRSQASDLIARGQVFGVDGVLTKPSTMVGETTPIRLAEGAIRFVGRGGHKLDFALESFGIPVEARVCLDIGSSTGGFTDCLLQRGASRVVAVDVGHGQMDGRLRADERVTLHEDTDIRHVTAVELGGPFPLVAVDVSFISLGQIAARLAEMASDHLVVLCKPQFEVGRAALDKRGVVVDREEREKAVRAVRGHLETAGLRVVEVVESPMTGGDGNIEYLLHARHSEEGRR